ncbi:IPT/TIG domain-containing protein [Tamlana fucoidanivorans]|uniref:IPT/TIG domain-containing protein n=1 Tax=Allotamlana fucoidanivorans TaxID=2583814 RepID=A0A5C4SSM4_9FLAO|nr:IPT/TIG domain-containing protein [Tamlana fucoidanivorans]TNJ47128.1 hypothetical protein FGF67_00990 [Tamlana fucoidanivorans]
MKKTIIYFSIILLTFSSCQKDENLPPNNNNVYITTLDYKLLDGGGVSLTGKIGNVELPIDYGFIISTIENDTYNSNSQAKFLTGIHNGDFTLDFKSNLREGITYYYNTITFKNGEYVYGNEKSFISNGSANPQIESVEPNKAHLGDTITINGKNFSKSPQVFFNTWSSEALIGNDTLIKCIVINKPEHNVEKLPFVELKVRSFTSNETIYDEFALHTPVVDSIRPYEAFPGDTITIYGNHFNRKSHGNRLIISQNTGTSAYPEVIKASQKELQFVIRRISTYEPSITIESQSQTIIAKKKFKHILPTISSISKNTVKYGEKLVVYGSNFPNKNSYTNDTLRYKLGSKQMSFFENYRDSLVIDMNSSFDYEGFIINGLSINFFGNDIKLDEKITLDENYVRASFNTDNIIGYGTINEDLYAVAYPYSFNDKYLIKFNKEVNNFEKLYPNDYLSKAPKGFNFSFHGTKFYSFNNNTGTLKFYSYDIFTNQENELEPFPGEQRFNPFMAVVGDYIYYGLGDTTIDGINDIWRYSINTNQWEFVLNLPEIETFDKAKVRPLSFSIDSKLYIGGGQNDFKPQLLDFWEIDTNTNLAAKKADLPITISQRIEGINIDGKGHFDYGGSTYIYDPSTNSWSIKPTGINFNGFNKHFLETENFVFSKEGNYIIKIKKSHFN